MATLPPEPAALRRRASGATTEEAAEAAAEVRWFSAFLSVVVLALAVELERPQSDVETVRLKLGAILLASAWAGPLTVVAGKHLYGESWRYLQPFAGGGGFVVLQAMGWLLYSVAVFALIVAVLNAELLGEQPRGAIAGLGGLMSSAQLVLNGSLRFFQNESLATTEEKPSLSKRWTACSLILSCAGLLLLALADPLLRTADSPLELVSAVLMGCGVVAHLLAAVWVHCVHGRLVHGRAYRLWMPFQGGAVFVLLQALSWTLFGCIVDVLGAVSLTTLAQIRALPLTMGLSGLVANVVLIFSLLHFKPTGDDQRGFQGGLERSVAVLFVGMAFLGFTVELPYKYVDMQNAFPVAYVSALVLAHAAPVLAHCGAARTVPGFSLLQVGRGGPVFVIAQGCGWMLYAISGLTTLITAVNGPQLMSSLSWTRATAPLALLSSATLVASVGLFQPDADDDDFFIMKEQEEEVPAAAAAAAALPMNKPLKWLVRCDASALEVAPSAQRREACADMCRLRALATTPEAAALLDAAAAALASDFNDDDSEEEQEEDEPVKEEDLRLAPSLLRDYSGYEDPTWLAAWCRAALSRVAAPLGCLCGVVLLAVAPEAPRGSRLPLAFAALFSTLASAPLHLFLEKRRPKQQHPSSVVLQLVALAAWSFSVLVALVAALRYTACNGCALAYQVMTGAITEGAPPGLPSLGALGVAIQFTALLLLGNISMASSNKSDDGDNNQEAAAAAAAAAVSWGEAPHQQQKTTTTQRRRSSLKKHQNQQQQNKTAPSSLSVSWSRISQLGGQVTTLLDTLPDETWFIVESRLSARDLAVLASCAKRPRRCALYSREATWRRLFLAREQHQYSRRRRSISIDDEHGLLEDVGIMRFWSTLVATIEPNVALLQQHDEEEEPLVHHIKKKRRLSHRCSRALGWKLACVLGESGAPLVRCFVCAEVDLGDDDTREFIAPCANCPGLLAHRACLERTHLRRSRVFFGGAGLEEPSDLVAKFGSVGSCSCGAAHTPTARTLRTPAELVDALRSDWPAVEPMLRRVTLRCLGGLVLLKGSTRILLLSHSGYNHPLSQQFGLGVWLFLQSALLELLCARRFSVMVNRLWAVGGRKLRFYLALYLYQICASTLLFLSFSPISLLLLLLTTSNKTKTPLDHASFAASASQVLAGLLTAAFSLAAWANLVVYAAVSSTTLFIFVRANYSMLTLGHTGRSAPPFPVAAAAAGIVD